MAGKNQIIGAIREGIRCAQDNYNKASSSPLCWAPEYFMDVHIFQSLFTLTQADSLTLQHNNRDLLKDKHIRGRKINELKDRSKIDLVLWYSNQGKERAYIEVKRRASVCTKDIKRICFLLKHDGQFGVLTSAIYERYVFDKPYAFQLAKNKLTKRLKNIETDINNSVASFSNNLCVAKLIDDDICELPLEKDHNNRLWVWRPVCFVIDKK